MAARSTRSLTENRITHILSVCTDPIPAEVPESGICHLRIPVEDVDYADLLIQMPTACRFIEQSLRSGGVVLVHCGQGLSRSPAIVAAYCKLITTFFLICLSKLTNRVIVMWSKRVGVAAAVDMVRDGGFECFSDCDYSNKFYFSARPNLDQSRLL